MLAGRRIVVAGVGPLPIVVAAQILRAGGSVAALATLNSLSVAGCQLPALWSGRELVREGLRYLATVIRARVPRLTNHVPVRVNGGEQVESVVLARIDRGGAVMPRSEREIACDVVAVNYGFAANTELAAMAGIAMRHDPPRGGWLPVVDEFGRTSSRESFAAGDAAGCAGARRGSRGASHRGRCCADPKKSRVQASAPDSPLRATRKRLRSFKARCRGFAGAWRALASAHGRDDHLAARMSR